jgi:hypothetical protein
VGVGVKDLYRFPGHLPRPRRFRRTPPPAAFPSSFTSHSIPFHSHHHLRPDPQGPIGCLRPPPDWPRTNS